jgi:hypothetical protein
MPFDTALSTFFFFYLVYFRSTTDNITAINRKNEVKIEMRGEEKKNKKILFVS